MHYTGQLNLPELFGKMERGDYDIKIPHGTAAKLPKPSGLPSSPEPRQPQQQGGDAVAVEARDASTSTETLPAASVVSESAAGYWFPWLWGAGNNADSAGVGSSPAKASASEQHPQQQPQQQHARPVQFYSAGV